MAGLVLVVFARGCGTVGLHSVARVSAKADQATAELDSRKREDQKAASKDRSTIDPKKYEDDAEHIKELVADARDASYDNRMWAYWYEWIFVVASMLLVLGLVSVGFTGEKSERIVALVILVILTFSIYVGGVAWIGPSISNLTPTRLMR